MENYEQLLDEAYKKIKPIQSTGERFEVPKIEGHLEGSKTILTNIPQIISYIRRNQDHLVKFILKELATAGSMKNNILISISAMCAAVLFSVAVSAQEPAGNGAPGIISVPLANVHEQPLPVDGLDMLRPADEDHVMSGAR